MADRQRIVGRPTAGVSSPAPTRRPRGAKTAERDLRGQPGSCLRRSGRLPGVHGGNQRRSAGRHSRRHHGPGPARVRDGPPPLQRRRRGVERPPDGTPGRRLRIRWAGTMTLTSAALAYAAAGLAVLPLHQPITRPDGRIGCSCVDARCRSVGKHPRTAHGLHDATADPARVAAWWRRWPQANIGLATGDRFEVLDVDGPAGLRALRQLAEGGLSLPGPLVRTGGAGWHHYLAPLGRGNAQPIRGLERVDWRGRGGYVVAPPSRHASGTRYRWLRPLTDELPQAPAPLRELLVAVPVRPPCGPPSAPIAPCSYALAALLTARPKRGSGDDSASTCPTPSGSDERAAAQSAYPCPACETPWLPNHPGVRDVPWAGRGVADRRAAPLPWRSAAVLADLAMSPDADEFLPGARPVERGSRPAWCTAPMTACGLPAHRCGLAEIGRAHV